jgi:hypothetical protein
LRSGTLQSRGRTKLGISGDPGSAKSYALHRARETKLVIAGLDVQTGDITDGCSET